MCLFDIVGGFYSIRESLEKTVGPAAGTLLYQAGIKGGKRFTSSASKIGMIRKGPLGLQDCVEVFSQAGFGNFAIVDANWSECHVLIECDSPMPFEAFAYKENSASTGSPVCDYTRGVLAGFCQQLVDREDILCIETECKAANSSQCVFQIGAQRKMTAVAMGINARL